MEHPTQEELNKIKIKDLEFCPICNKVLRDEHICQGSENEDNLWK